MIIEVPSSLKLSFQCICVFKMRIFCFLVEKDLYNKTVKSLRILRSANRYLVAWCYIMNVKNDRSDEHKTIAFSPSLNKFNCVLLPYCCVPQEIMARKFALFEYDLSINFAEKNQNYEIHLNSYSEVSLSWLPSISTLSNFSLGE